MVMSTASLGSDSGTRLVSRDLAWSWNEEMTSPSVHLPHQPVGMLHPEAPDGEEGGYKGSP